MNLRRAPLVRAARRRWPRIKRVLPWIVLALALGLLGYFGGSVDWPGVWQAVRRIPRETLLLAAALVVPAYLAYAALDLLGRRYTGHRLPWPKVLGVALLSYALNLNLGVLLGGLGTRLRLYARLGCRKATATRVAVFSAVSNWIGYAWVAGAVFASGAIVLPAGWDIGGGVLRLMGLGLLAMAALYVWICARATRRVARWMGQRVTLPGGRMAVLQSVTAALSWLLMGPSCTCCYRPKSAIRWCWACSCAPASRRWSPACRADSAPPRRSSWRPCHRGCRRRKSWARR
ncbi:lysylphosphatidylglycerol synthase transmembrane domain-containing protein [Achromobacter dolens]|uniref:lysylphosphatidylglycerol synthase transmembrane domain-containing protein n=1 Tax=Achromobacter dolens TaxID=1287738 RepID=UPI003B9A49EC